MATIEIDLRNDVPSLHDWQRIETYFVQLSEHGWEGIDELHVEYVPRRERDEQREEDPVANGRQPVWQTSDPSGFAMTLYSDGSDSEG
jgi:hypothetical protein